MYDYESPTCSTRHFVDFLKKPHEFRPCNRMIVVITLSIDDVTSFNRHR